MTIISLEKLLKTSTDGTLKKIVQNAQFMDDLTSSLKRELEPDLACQLLAANVREGGELVLIASSSAWAAKLRFEGDRLMAVAVAAGCKLRSYRVSVSKTPSARNSPQA